MAYQPDNPDPDYRMDPDVKARCLKALRSGKYKQVRNKLRSCIRDPQGQTESDEIGYCCLGVGCDILGEGHWVDDYDDTFVLEDTHYQGYNAPFLPYQFSELLAEMNDDAGWSFEQIADWVEKNL